MSAANITWADDLFDSMKNIQSYHDQIEYDNHCVP